MATTTSDIVTSLTPFQGGVAPVPSTGPHKVIKVNGTWAADESFTLTVIFNNVQYDLGKKDITEADITYVTSFRNQIMLCAGSRLYFSGLDEPTGWENRFSGYGFLEISGERGEALEALAVTPYAGKLAVFSRHNVQLWLPNADPANWQLVQSLENVGTCSPKSVISYGELDVFFLSDSGLRSLRTRENIDLVNVQDVGTQIDKIFQSEIAALTETQLREQVFGYFDTKTGRYIIYIGGSLYCFSYFPSNKVAAWSKFTCNTRQSDGSAGVLTPFYTTVKDGLLYLYDHVLHTLSRYPYGSYYSTSVVVLPFFDVKSPATRKHFYAIDLVGTGTWNVEIGDDTNAIGTFMSLVNGLDLSTVSYARIPLGFHSTHATLRLTNATNEAAVIAKVIWHYQLEDSR